MATNKLSRREFLKLSGVAAAGAVLASCTSPKTATPVATTGPTTQPPVTAAGNVVLMTKRGEFSEAQQTAFTDANPDITIEFVEDNQQRFFAMLAAGVPLDIYRNQCPNLPNFLIRKLPYDMTAYFQAGGTISIDDLAPANKGWWLNSPFEVGTGKIYGMVKDWSPDMTNWVNDAKFEEAGVPVLDDTKAYTLQEVYDIAKSVAKFDGDRIVTWAWGGEPGWYDRYLCVYLKEKNLTLYKDAFSAVDLGDDAKALIKWYYDLAAEKLRVSSVNPSPNGWGGGDFTAGIEAIQQYGYWFGGMAETDQNRGKVRMMPAPTYSGVHSSPTVTATGWLMLAGTQVADAAWKVFEYYMGGQPSIDRAGSGWGVPGLLSQYPLMPNATPFQQQVQQVLAGEMAVADFTFVSNPFLGEGAFMNVWNVHENEALTGVITFDDMVTKIGADVNALIKTGIASAA